MKFPNIKTQLNTLLSNLKKESIGGTIKQFCKQYISKKDQTIISKSLLQLKNGKLPLLATGVKKSIKLMNNFIEDPIIVYLSVVLTNSDCDQKSIKQLALKLLQFFHLMGFSLNFVLMCLSQDVITTISGLNLLTIYDSIGLSLLIQYTKINGKTYLKSILREIILEIVKNEKNLNFEIDAKIIKDKNELIKNQNNIIYYFEKFLNSIFSSIRNIPKFFLIIGNHLRKEVSARFPDTISTVIGSSIFINFFCKAILNPLGYGIINNIRLSQKSLHALQMLSKAITAFSNGELFTKHESSMMFINKVITNKFNERSKFVDIISTGLNIEEQLHINNKNNDIKSTLIPSSTSVINQYYSHLLLNFDKDDKPKPENLSEELIFKFRTHSDKNVNINDDDLTKQKIISNYQQLKKIENQLKSFIGRIGGIEYNCLTLKTELNKKNKIGINNVNNNYNVDEENGKHVDDDLVSLPKIENFDRIKKISLYGKIIGIIKLPTEAGFIFSSSLIGNKLFLKKYFIIKNNLISIFSFEQKLKEKKPEEIIIIHPQLSIKLDYSMNRGKVVIIFDKLIKNTFMFAFETEKIDNFLQNIKNIQKEQEQKELDSNRNNK